MLMYQQSLWLFLNNSILFYMNFSFSEILYHDGIFQLELNIKAKYLFKKLQIFESCIKLLLPKNASVSLNYLWKLFPYLSGYDIFSFTVKSTIQSPFYEALWKMNMQMWWCSHIRCREGNLPEIICIICLCWVKDREENNTLVY